MFEVIYITNFYKCTMTKIGDSGYALKSWLITPLRSNPNDPREQRFNVAHKRTRRIVENAIGILKNRFMVLKMMRVSPEFAAQVVIACATLHNIARKGDFLMEVDETDGEDVEGAVEEEEDEGARNRVEELLRFF